MSKRRKQHRATAAKPEKTKVRDVYVPRPFADLPNEGDWIAMRELLPAATAPLTVKPEYADKLGDRQLTLATVLPLAWPAMSRADGQVFVAMQRQFQSGDVSRDIAASLLAALDAEPGHPVAVPARPGEGPRMQDVIELKSLEVSIHDTFDFWLGEDTDTDDPQVSASMERANASIYPTSRLDAAKSAYWCQTPDNTHVRIVLEEDEDAALAALARLRAAEELKLVPDSKFAGMFRTHGVLIPVWDLAADTVADDCEKPVTEFAVRYAEALASTEPLTSAERRAKDGLVGRQLNLR
ncbi:DUF5926 family protein [Stackebrandtia nassauensis]|uniref:DUF5926 domain-containing protein n=1 Tax=Stackebrandtia nassauensis (strain DSM 44728 / CIP 108903 / NRRL B-16338 / NBRC 102104 / LLR-40K-21) TaxID=446470 RepID=D3Q5M0_STANL|nr:DUF5926 family protein [Stackebrandtia nassauensis]ADD46080.1 hypothetical protein Snas_6465 [Stackebrandtia nassauensis DSM 44728]